MENESKLSGLVWLGTAIIFISVLSVILIVIIHQNRILKIREQESKARLNTALESEKQERFRIASNLHDGISGDLNAVRNYIAILSGTLKDANAIHLLGEMEEAVKNAAENIQNISYNLMPPMLESHGLITTLQSYLARIRKSHNINICEVYDAGLVNIPTPDAYEMYRIIQEVISNTIKHGKANFLEVAVTGYEKDLLFTITDNGHEFNISEKLHSCTGMGLKNISARLLKLNTKLEHTFINHYNSTKIYYHVKDSHS
jgi:signal transduction histidine kinase